MGISHSRPSGRGWSEIGEDKNLMDYRPKRILVLYCHHSSINEMRRAVYKHLHVFDQGDVKHQIIYYNAMHGAPSWLRHSCPDAVILHTTLLCLRWSDYFLHWKNNLGWVGELDCIKIALPQDEYDHSEILDEWLWEWGISVIFTNFDKSKRKLLYPIMHDKAYFQECFTGYLDHPAGAQRAEAFSEQLRSNHIVYRATQLPYCFGSHGQLKHRIGEVVAKMASAYDLQVDISTKQEDTIVGDEWLRFLASSKAVIGCESGSSVLDRRGEIRAQINVLLNMEPNISFEGIRKQLSCGWDDYDFFALSPRHFEAIMTKTCQILVEGDYSGVLEPNKHYIPLKKDFSNLDEVLERVRDDPSIQDMAERAYHDIYLSGRYTYRTFANRIDQALRENANPRQRTRTLFDQLTWPVAHFKGYLATFSIETRARYHCLLQAVQHATNGSLHRK